MNVPYVDLGAQYASHRESILAEIDRVLSSGQYILGEDVARFEARFAELCGVRHAISVANGTDSLIMAMRALGIGPGDEVITAPNSWISSASSIALVGAKPVFVDVRADQNMNPDLLQAAITPRTKAIMPVHLTGKCAEMGPILEIARKNNLHVIEDAAQAVSARYDGKCSGSMGIVGSFSLHPLKNLNACGDAGILTTNDDAFAQNLKQLRHHGLLNRNEVAHWGYNSRLDSLQAAILNVRLPHLPEVIERRRANARLYYERLSSYVMCPQEAPKCFDVYHLFVIQTANRDALQAHLLEKGIHTAIHYPIPIHLQKAAEYLGYKPGSFPVVEKQSKEILSLPVHQNLSLEQVEYVCAEIIGFLGRPSRRI